MVVPRVPALFKDHTLERKLKMLLVLVLCVGCYVAGHMLHDKVDEKLDALVAKLKSLV